MIFSQNHSAADLRIKRKIRGRLGLMERVGVDGLRGVDEETQLSLSYNNLEK